MQANTSDLTTARRISPFTAASKKTLSRLFAEAVAYDFAEKSRLFREGDPPRYVYVLLDGFVALESADRQANDYVIDFLKSGDVFVLSAALLNRPYFVSCQVLTPSRILTVPASVFRECAKMDLGFSAALNEVLSHQRGALAAHVKSLKTQPPLERLAAFLLSHTAQRTGQATVRLPCDRKMVAAWLGIVPGTASRVFRELERKCGIDGRGRDIRVRSVERLAECAGVPISLPEAAKEIFGSSLVSH